MTRADMESAHGVPIVTSGCFRAGRVIGIDPCGCDLFSHDGRIVSTQTQGGKQGFLHAEPIRQWQRRCGRTSC